MKRILLLILLLAILGLGVLAVRSRLLKKKAQSRREAAYQVQLVSYTQDLKTGMTRKEVEGYFRANKIEFRQMCCVVTDEFSARHSWDDLVKIGEEDVPLFCSANSVYVAFRFADFADHDKSERQENDFDTLKSVTIYHQLEGCL